MRRAIEHLTAERTERTELPDAPDYSETLGVISHNLAATAERIEALVKSPALALTPEELGRQIIAASTARGGARTAAQSPLPERRWKRSQRSWAGSWNRMSWRTSSVGGSVFERLCFFFFAVRHICSL